MSSGKVIEELKAGDLVILKSRGGKDKDRPALILKVLSEVACGNTGTCQINLQSESARNMIADKLDEELQKYVSKLIEDIVTPQKPIVYPKLNK